MHNIDGFQQFFNDQPTARPSVSEIELVHMYLNNTHTKVSELAKTSGRSLPEFYRTLRRYNIEPNRLNSNQHLVQSYGEAGYSIPLIAQLTGYTTRNVRYILARPSKKF